jgi:hypothetical protein
LKNRPQPFSEQRNSQHERATEHCHGQFQACVKAQWSCPAERQRCRNCASKGEARHETRKNQRRGPDRIAKRQAAQSEPKSLKKERARAGKKKNDRDYSDAHEPKRACGSSALQARYLSLCGCAADFVEQILNDEAEALIYGKFFQDALAPQGVTHKCRGDKIGKHCRVAQIGEVTVHFRWKLS